MFGCHYNRWSTWELPNWDRVRGCEWVVFAAASASRGRSLFTAFHFIPSSHNTKHSFSAGLLHFVLVLFLGEGRAITVKLVHLAISDATSCIRAFNFSMIVTSLSVVRVPRAVHPPLPSRKTPAHNTTNTPDTTQNDRRTISRHRRASQSREHRSSRDASNTSLNIRCNTP